MLKALCVATNRQDQINKWRKKWYSSGMDDWDRLYIVIDGEWNIESKDSREVILNRNDIRKDGLAGIVSFCSSAIKSYGFYRAYKDGFDTIGCLDDDCLPIVQFPLDSEEVTGFFRSHVNNMSYSTIQSTCDSPTLVRGMPYTFNRWKHSDLNIGLWCNIGDLDSITTLSLQRRDELNKFIPNPSMKIVPRGIIVPMSGMNIVFSRRLVPAMYFPGGIDNTTCRYDDIWAGLICKAFCDSAGLNWTIGGSTVEHNRLSNVVSNLETEAKDFGTNEELHKFFCTVINEDAVPPYLGSDIETLRALIKSLSDSEISFKSDRIKWICARLKKWNKLFT